MRAAVVVALALIALLALGIWLIVRDEISTLRTASAKAPPLDPRIRNAILAAEGSHGTSPFVWGLVRSISPPRRALRWQFETSVTGFVVSRLFDREELLRIYAHEIYLGTVARQHVYGVDKASHVYYQKPVPALTTAEAATLAAMIRSPNFYSPLRNPDRALDRRNRVLKRMLELGFIDRKEFQRAIEQPL